LTSSGARSGSFSGSLLNTNSKKSNKNDKSNETERYELPNGLVTVLAIINPELLEVDETLGVYAFSQSCYILANSMILDNGAIINLINNKTKLELRSFIKASGLSATIKCGTQRLLIISYRTYMLRGVFNQGKRDLILNNIAVIKGFHTNIISEYKLRSLGI
jgi:hypothetical protein